MEIIKNINSRNIFDRVSTEGRHGPILWLLVVFLPAAVHPAVVARAAHHAHELLVVDAPVTVNIRLLARGDLVSTEDIAH